jgi:hypothetical protein
MNKSKVKRPEPSERIYREKIIEGYSIPAFIAGGLVDLHVSM